jgi:hypothetical protein
VSAGNPTEVKMYKGGLNVSAYAGRSDATRSFIYQINGKRGTIEQNRNLHNYTQGIYIIDGKDNANPGAQKVLNTFNK